MEHVTENARQRVVIPRQNSRKSQGDTSLDLLTHPTPGRRYLTTCKRSDALALMRVYTAELRSRGLAGVWGIEATPPPRGGKGWRLWATPHATPDNHDQETGERDR